jgi:glutamate synthase domain-containing protein 2
MIIAALSLSALAAVFVWDRWVQREHAILRNFPVIGHARYALERLGEFLRQYFYTADWEERPFDRLTRSWIYRSAKGEANALSFGSELDQNQPGHVRFLNSPFPVDEADARPWAAPLIGAGRARTPWRPGSFFNVSAMSFGALSGPAVTALSRGAAEAGMWLDTGEGGLSPYHLDGGCDIVAEIGTAKYGVRGPGGALDEDKLRELAALPQVRLFLIKLSQGAKPGKGGILPGAKVTAEVARIRGIPLGEDSLSPNRHAEITDAASLGAMVARVRAATGKPTGVKFALGDAAFLDEWFSMAASDPALAPDFIQVDGAEGGTGSAPAALADHVGRPVAEALPMVVAALERHGLRREVAVVASGRLTTPDKVAWALAAGADVVVSARGFMMALGCIQSMRCGSGRCPTGVATHDPRYTRGLDPDVKARRVAAYARSVVRDVEAVAHACGCAGVHELSSSHIDVLSATLNSRRR